MLVKGVQTISLGERIPANWYTQAGTMKGPARSPAGIPQPCSAETASGGKGRLRNESLSVLLLSSETARKGEVRFVVGWMILSGNCSTAALRKLCTVILPLYKVSPN